MKTMNSKGPVSGWQQYRASSTALAVVSGRKAESAKVLPSILRSQGREFLAHELPNLLYSLFHFHDDHFSTADLDLHFTFGKGFFPNVDPDRESNQFRILELATGTFVTIVQDR